MRKKFPNVKCEPMEEILLAQKSKYAFNYGSNAIKKRLQLLNPSQAGVSMLLMLPLKDFLPEERPNVFLTFMSFRIMIALGTLFIFVTLLTCFFWWRGSLFEKRWLMWVWVFMVLGAYAGNQLGWCAAEFGRQPYIVYPMYADPGETTDREGVIDRRGVDEGEAGEIVPAGTLVTEEMQRVRLEPGLRTKDSASRVLKGPDVLASTIMFGLIYSLLLALYLFVMNSKIQTGPDEPAGEADEAGGEGFLRIASERAGEEGRMTGNDPERPESDDINEGGAR